MTSENDWFVLTQQNLISEKLDTIRVLTTLVTDMVRTREAEKNPGKAFEINHEIGVCTGYMKWLQERINLNRGLIDEHTKRGIQDCLVS
jgi:hypothetical protein